MSRRVQPKLFGGAVTTYPTGPRKWQPPLPGLDARAVAQLDADAVRLFLEKLRAEALPELDDYTPGED